MGSMRKALQDKRVVLGGFRTVIKDGERPMIFMTAHQFIKTFYIAFLFRPLSFLRCCSTPLLPWIFPCTLDANFCSLAGAACMTAHHSPRACTMSLCLGLCPSSDNADLPSSSATVQPNCPSLAGHSCRRHSARRAYSGLFTLQKQGSCILTRGCGACRGARLLFGDQTLFCRACDFRRAGGYASRLPIMEDADLCIRLHMAGPGVSLAWVTGSLSPLLLWPVVLQQKDIHRFGRALALQVHTALLPAAGVQYAEQK